jgi:hypothetical protein
MAGHPLQSMTGLMPRSGSCTVETHTAAGAHVACVPTSHNLTEIRVFAKKPARGQAALLAFHFRQ